MTASRLLQYMLRESRGSSGRLIFFVVCLAVGVAAVVSVAGLSSGMEEGLRSRARDLLAADLIVQSWRPLPPELDEILAGMDGVRRTDARQIVTIVAAASGPLAGTSRLSLLKVVDGEYPFYGVLELEPSRPLADLLDESSAVVARELLSQMDLSTGGRIRVGGVEYTVAGILDKEPDRLDIGFSSLAPRIFLSPAGLGRSGLETRHSRVLHQALIRMPGGSVAADVKEAASTLEASLPEKAYLDVQTYVEAQPAIRTGIRRAERFLGLVALLSLLIGGIGVAQTVRAWLAGRMDAIAILRCLGMRPREILWTYLGQTALLGLAGSLVGVILGVAVQFTVPLFLSDVMPVDDVRPWQPMAMARGLVLGVAVALLFSLSPLTSAGRVPPARVFRRDAEPIPARLRVRAGIFAVISVGVFTTALVQSGSAAMASWFTLGGVVLAGVLGAAALLVTRAAVRLPRGMTRVWLRHGLSALARPGAATLGAIVALGLGVAVVLGMYLVEDGLGDQLEADLPDEAPSAFMMDIQPDQWDGVRRLLETEGAERVDSVPVVMARFRSVDGVPVREMLEEGPEDGRRRWVLTREQRLTYMKEIPEDNEIVEGSLWSDPERAEVSVEKRFAGDLGAGIGSVIVADIQGVPVELLVTSIRTVIWESFGINFFLIVEPGVLEKAPQVRLAAARLPAGAEQRIQDRLAASFPNVTLIRVRDVLDKIVGLLRQAGFGVRVLGAFTVIAGILILAGSVSVGSVRRGREVALLKTLGMTRSGVTAVYSVEYALVGLVAGLIGVGAGALLAFMVMTRWMDIPWKFRPDAFAVALGAAVILAVAAGTAASFRALTRRPVEVLREE